MTGAELGYYAGEALLLTLWLSLPTLAAAAAVGLLVALLQALTQLQEQTLGFVLKLAAVVAALTFSAGWAGQSLQAFTLRLFELIARV